MRAYTFTRDELEFLKVIDGRLETNQIKKQRSPEIYLEVEKWPIHYLKRKHIVSDDTPEEFYENKLADTEIKLDIDELLGVYTKGSTALNDSDGVIILYDKPIRALAKEIGHVLGENKSEYSYQILRTIVLLHEIGHWTEHSAWGLTILEAEREHFNNWKNGFFKEENRSLINFHEAWAQYFCYSLINILGEPPLTDDERLEANTRFEMFTSDYRQIFEQMLVRQDDVYHLFKKLLALNQSDRHLFSCMKQFRLKPLDFDKWLEECNKEGNTDKIDSYDCYKNFNL